MSLSKSKPLQNSQKKITKISDVYQMYDYCNDRGYDIYWYSLGFCGLECLSVQDDDGGCYIALDPYQFASEADEYCKGLHEIGHCDTGAFYNRHATCDIRQKAEHRADRRAIELSISADDLAAAVADGCTELWALAERFGVTEEFVKKAVCLYTRGNLATELYF